MDDGRTRPVALLDRDGTINVKAPEGEWIVHPDGIVMLPGAAEAIRRLNDSGVPVAVVSNQRGIALRLMSEDDLRAVNERVAAHLAEAGARIDLWLHCPHDRDAGCDCRKPAPGMLLEALERLHGDAAASLMVGDRGSDVGAGKAAGVPAVRIGPKGTQPDLAAAVDAWLSGDGTGPA